MKIYRWLLLGLTVFMSSFALAEDTQIILVNKSNHYSLFDISFMGPSASFDRSTQLFAPGESFAVPKEYFCSQNNKLQSDEACRGYYLIRVAGSTDKEYKMYSYCPQLNPPLKVTDKVTISFTGGTSTYDGKCDIQRHRKMKDLMR